MFPIIETHRPQIAALCREHRVLRLELFGSGARDDFDPANSDLDFLVEFENLGWKGSSNRYFGLLHGLEDLLNRKIDLVERRAVTNPLFLEIADRHRQLVYAAPVAKAS